MMNSYVQTLNNASKNIGDENLPMRYRNWSVLVDFYPQTFTFIYRTWKSFRVAYGMQEQRAKLMNLL